MGDVYPVLAGLRDGERVVIHGAFAIDADLQIQGGDSMMNLPDDEDGASHDPESHESVVPEAADAPARPAPKKRKRRNPPAPAGNQQHHMQGHQH